MKTNTIFRILCSFLFATFTSTSTSQIVVINNPNELIFVKNNINFLEDKTEKKTINDILSSKEFGPVKSDIPNFGVSTSSFWLRLQIKNNTTASNFLLQISQPGLDEVEVYCYNGNNRLISFRQGECYPFSQRQFFEANYIFKIQIPEAKTQIVYIKVKARDNIQVPITIGSKEKMLEVNKNRDVLMGVYLGIMLVMLFYNGFLFFTIKDKSYFYYLLHLVAVILTQASIQGYTFQYLWPNLPFLAGYSSFVFSPFVGIAGLYFMRAFLSVPTIMPKIDWFFWFFSGAFILAFFIAVFGYFDVSFILIEVTATAVSLFMLIVSYKIYKMGFRPAKFFLLAWSVFLVGVSIYVMKDQGVLPFNNFTNYTMIVGSAIEVVLLSLALADKINIYKKEKEDSSIKVIELLSQNQQIIKEQNVVLETKIKERTEELEASNKSLKEAEAILVNAEKMASLGQLTAGISHEINNPINFVVSNIKPLKRDVDELLMVLSKYSEIKDGVDLEIKLEEIQALKAKLDVDYLINEINLLLKGIDEGARRTSEIVRGLKSFSRSDEAELKKVDVHYAIELTLTLLYSIATVYNVKIIRNFGAIPEIVCYPGKLNQVFMNLLSNAMHAVNSRANKESTGLITIDTSQVADNVVINITDNGHGISAKNITKIFDPFFTTKEVGEGTGLGLSIVYGIIKKHNGSITVVSEENIKTTFTITLPLKH